MSLDTVTMLDANGAQQTFGVVTIGGAKVAAHCFVDSTGSLIGTPVNPLLTAPAVETVAPTDRGGSIATAGAVALTIAANTARKRGSITAAPGNQGIIYISVTGAATDVAGPGVQAALGPGASFPMLDGGYLYQGAISISGDTPGDKFLGVEYA